MKHFPLLGSVFRASIKQQRYAAEHPSTVEEKHRQTPQKVGILVNSKVVQTFPSPPLRESRTSMKERIVKPVVTPQKHSNLSSSRTTESFNTSVLDGIMEEEKTTRLMEKTTQERVEGPKVFYANVLNPCAPPSTSNFAQLEEMLQRLISADNEGDPLKQHQAYESVFLEVIRQYFIECSSQGRLLDKCRLFFSSVTKYIPKLKTKFEAELMEITKKTKQNKEFSDQMKNELKPMAKKQSELDAIMNDLKIDFSTRLSHYEKLSTVLSATYNEAENLKRNSQKIDSKINEMNQELIRMNEELRMMDDLSAKATQDTVVASERLKELIKEQTELTRQSDSEHETLIRKRKSNREIMAKVKELRKKLSEENERIKHTTIAIQADLNQRTNKSGAVQQAKNNYIMNVKKKNEDSLIKVLSEYNKEESKQPEFPTEGISINKYDDFAQLKRTIIENNAKFQMTKEEIVLAESGDFSIETYNESYVKLFASRIISNCIDTAARKVPQEAIGTQTQTRAQNTSSKESIANTSKDTTNRFTKLIPADYSRREPQTIPWMLKNLRNIYDEKYQSDIKHLEERTRLQPLSEFIVDFASRHNNLDFLAYQFCWDIYNTSLLYYKMNREVEMFYKALTEEIDIEQLCFMLICRDLILKIGAVVTIKNDDSPEQVSEFYLSQDQLEQALHKWWRDRYNPKFYTRLMTFAVSRPATYLEAMKRYVSAADILFVMVDEFQKDKIERMYELLASTRITPRILQKDFINLMNDLVPHLTDDDYDRFFRATVTKTLNRREISKEDFSHEFLNGSLLFVHDDLNEIDLKQDELLETITEQWNTRREKITLMVNYFEGIALQQTDDLQFRSQVSDTQRYLLMMEHSLQIRNASEACNNYFHLLFALDTLFSTIDEKPSEDSLVSLECCIKENWLDSIFINTETNV